MQKIARCLLCGAELPGGETCRERFDRAQALEFNQPGFFAVHHLSVPAYLLQHAGYTPVQQLAARELLSAFLSGSLIPQDAVHFLQDKTALKVPPAASENRRSISWSMTIANVRLDSPAHYCGDVTAWAKSVLDDLQRSTVR